MMGMSRPLRFIPEGGALVEVTTRTIQGRLLLRPSQKLNDVFLGVLGRAQSRHPLEVVAYCCLSSHYHLLLRVDNAKQLSDFMTYFNGNLAKEVARLTGWKDRVWSRRYQAIVISDEEEAQVERLLYILGNCVKEGLVGSPLEWPGVHCARALITGERVEGTWFNRSLESNASLRGETYEERKYASIEVVHLSPLPCWKHLSEEVYRERVAELIRQIEQDAAVQRQEAGIPLLGADGVKAQNPETRPRKLKKSLAPLFHAFRKAARKALYEAYAWFVAAYREAAAKLRSGDRTVAFPRGCFPPRLPFVAA